MRKIPTQITDAGVKAKLTAIDQQIDDKMKKVNTLRDQAKKTGFSDVQLQELKKMGGEIDRLDKEWKALTES